MSAVRERTSLERIAATPPLFSMESVIAFQQTTVGATDTGATTLMTSSAAPHVGDKPVQAERVAVMGPPTAAQSATEDTPMAPTVTDTGAVDSTLETSTTSDKPLSAADALSKATEACIAQLSTRAWQIALQNGRRTLHRGDVAEAILRNPDEYMYFIKHIPVTDLPVAMVADMMEHTAAKATAPT